MKTRSLSISVSESIGKVSAEVTEPSSPAAVLALAHGAGANMHHRFMKTLAEALAEHKIAVVRYNFPFTESGKGRPDPPAIAEKTVNSVVHKVHDLYPKLPLFAGGKSFGGRMTTQYVSKDPPPFLSGIILFGFPLHAPGKASTERGDHLKAIAIPLLFLQGTRDALADLKLITKVARGLKTSTLKTFEGADHSFKSGKKEFIPEIASSAAEWIETLG